MLVIKECTSGGWFWIVLSFTVAMYLTLLPLPLWLESGWPLWSALVLIYWCVVLPDRVGIAVAWVVGFFLDAAQGSALGMHALGFTILAYVAKLGARRLSLVPCYQQAILVSFYLFLYKIIAWWIQGVIGVSELAWGDWLPVLSSLVVWPWLVVLLERVCLSRIR